jgi:hypothetical protein
VLEDEPVVDLEHLAALGRFTRGTGNIELATTWIAEKLVSPDWGVGAAVVDGQVFARKVSLARKLIPLRLSGSTDEDQRLADQIDNWLTSAGAVMRQRNVYVHAFWIGGHDGPDAMLLRRDQQFQEVSIEVLRGDADEAEKVGRQGADLYWRLADALRFAL